MNCNPVFSLPASAGDLLPHRRMKLTATGVAYCAAADASIGTKVAGDLNREQATIQSKSVGIHFAETSSATALAVGDEIQGAAEGKVTKKASGTAIGQVTEACAEEGAVIRVIYY